MCQYIETFHVYTDCHLKDTHNGQPTRVAAFLRDVTNRIRGQQKEDDGVKEENPGGDLEHHQIKQKNIWQCPKAIKDVNQKETPEHKRVCPDPKYWEGEDKLGQIQSLGITVHRATCPVCAAIEKVIEEKSNQTIIIPLQEERGQKAANGQKKHGTVHVKGSGTSRDKPIVHGPPRPAIVRTPVNDKRRQSRHGECRLM